MDQSGGRTILTSAAPRIRARLADLPPGDCGCSRRFTQSEELFLELDEYYEVPPIAIHHDVNRREPSAGFLSAVEAVLDQVVPVTGGLLAGLSLGFNPLHASSALFYRVLERRGQRFIYLVTVDLSYRPLLHQVVTAGSNDVAPAYRTNRIFLAPDLVPLQDDLRVQQSISQTWIGETGRGYITQGIWIDRDLNKFLTRLFVAPGQLIYPYFPFHTKFKAICFSPIELGAGFRPRAVELIDSARAVLLPRIDDILETLREAPFSEELELFREMRAAVDPGWHEVFADLRLRAYLNEHDMKEYIVERQ
ncbi:MAG: hypothetical protein EA384_13110 [Spirochaetaceae bacterium]|nr:MAG: hypothetical protein EA384_13110 [Spirochaetaceae bacterium]